MLISRRLSLRMLLGAGLWPKLFAGPALFEVDRLAATSRAGQRVRVWQRRYRTSATITLLSVPVFSRADVGTGFTVIEDAGLEDAARTVAIQFGAGSWPEAAHGLNRLGYIQEVVLDGSAGDIAECAYFAFMTSSQEKNLDQARKALETTAGAIPYAAAEGIGRDGHFTSRLDRIAFPAALTWRDYPLLIEKVRSAVAGESPAQTTSRPFGGATFLYCVRKALLAPDEKTSANLIYNGKEFELRTVKQPDAAMGEKMTERGLVTHASRVMRLNATLHDFQTGVVTPFRVWFDAGAAHLPPLRFEYQAKPFLRLAFEYDPGAAGPPLVPSLATSLTQKENS
jgi:hypothetical protein